MAIEFEVDGWARRAALWLPAGFEMERPEGWPLVVFLHAYEERGDDFEHLAVGIGPTLDARPELYPAIVLLPQCPRGHVWSVVDRPWAAGQLAAEAHIDAAIAAVCARYPIDTRRMSLTGASMGGYGAFGFGGRHAERFRAFAPVCGGGTSDDARALATRPVWVVHGTADDVVPIDESRRMVEAMRALGAGELRFSEVADAGHDVWNVAYGDAEFARFLTG